MEAAYPVLAFTQGDPAGVGPELLLRLAAERPADSAWYPLLVAEQAAFSSLEDSSSRNLQDRLIYVDSLPTRSVLASLGDTQVVLDPVGRRRQVIPGEPGPADAGGAICALDAGLDLVRRGIADALVTAPVSKQVVARHHLPSFRGHTDYLASVCGLERYGRDYLMAFLAPDLQVALLSTHLPLREALDRVTASTLIESLQCLDRHTGGRLAVAGLNPHAGEQGLLGVEDEEIIVPALRQAQALGIDVSGPESPDSVFARSRSGEFDWVLSLYHDQGLIAIKSVAFGQATNWTLGLPVLRTSVDHGTAYSLAGSGRADVRPLQNVVATTLKLLSGELPRGARQSS